MDWTEDQLFLRLHAWLVVCPSSRPILTNAISQEHTEGISSNLSVTWRQIFKVKGHFDFTKQLLTKFHKYLIGWNDDIFQKVEGHLHCEVIVFCKNTFLAVIQNHNWRTEG